MTAFSTSSNPEPKPYRFTVEEFEKLEFSDPEARVELLDGEIFEMSPIGENHAFETFKLQEILDAASQKRYLIWNQNPIRLSSRSRPQPDLVLLEPPLKQYKGKLPEPAQIGLLVEIADSSLWYDRNKKLSLYANAGISEVWILNLKSSELEVYREPSEDGYGMKQTLKAGQAVTPLCLGVAVNWWDDES
jgi:Uma2 family endonuclease